MKKFLPSAKKMRFLMIVLVSLLVGVASNAQSWTDGIYTGDVLPKYATPAWNIGDSASGTPVAVYSIIPDPAVNGNNLLQDTTTASGDKKSWKLPITKVPNATWMIRVKAGKNPQSMEFEMNGSNGAATRINFKLVNYKKGGYISTQYLTPASIYPADSTLNVNNFHTIRITVENGTDYKMYLDEKSTPVITGTGGSSTQSQFLRFGDVGSAYTAGAVDWMAWDVTGAYAPGTTLPTGVIVDGTGSSTSTDATLSALTSSAGTLSPVFAAGTTTYSVILPAGTTTVPTIAATVNEAHATTVITQPLSVTGSGTVVVTAQDGTTKQTYTVNYSVAAAQSSDATLSALSVANNTLSPTFVSGTTAYNVVLPFGTTIGNLPAVTYTAAANATAVKTDATALPGTTTINVTAQDGTTTKAYTISFTVAAASTDATLSDLKVGSTTIAGFAAGTLTYNYTLTGGATVIPQISGTVTESHATTVVTQAATLLGTANIVVTAQDGTTKKTYSVTFKWATGINGISQDQLTYKVSSNTVTIESGSTINNVEVTDINGKLMVEKNIGSTSANVSTEGWSSGIYVFTIQTKDGVVTRKIGIVK